MSAVNERALKNAIDASLAGVAILDEDGTYMYVNQAHADVYGYDDTDAFLGEHWEMCYSEDQVEAVDAVFETLETDGEWQGELEGVRADGSVFPQELSLATLDDGGLVCVVRDLTDRRQHERELSAMNEATRGLMAATDRDAIADTVVDIARRVLDETLIAVWFRTDDADRLEPTAATDEAQTLPNGERLPVHSIEPGSYEWRAYAERDPTFVEDYAALPDSERANPDAPLGAIAIVPLGEHGVLSAAREDPEPFGSSERDVLRVLALNAAAALDRAEREAELAAKNERLGEFASVVSHDLRNPLSIIRGNAELAKQTGEEEPLEEVIDAADRMNRLVDDLLSLAREGESVGDREAVSLEAVALRAWGAVQTADAELRVEADATISADPARLQELLENCFRNSVEHGSTSSRTQSDDSVEHGYVDGAEGEDASLPVTVAATDDGFVVADDGVGIPESEYEAVFEHGYTTNEDGTGFGLAIVERIASGHGWTVTVESSPEGGAQLRFSNVQYED